MKPQDDLPVGTVFDLNGRTLIVAESPGNLCAVSGRQQLRCLIGNASYCSAARCGGTEYSRKRSDGRSVAFVLRDAYLAARLAGEV